MDDLKSIQFFGKVRSDAYTVRGMATGRPKPQEPQTPVPSPKALAGTLQSDSLSRNILSLDSVQTDSLRVLSDTLGLLTDSLSVTPAGLDIPETDTDGGGEETPSESPSATPGGTPDETPGAPDETPAVLPEKSPVALMKPSDRFITTRKEAKA